MSLRPDSPTPISICHQLPQVRWSTQSAILLFALCLPGCGDAAKPVSSQSPATSQTTAADEARRKLSSAIQRIQPETLATQSRRETVVNGLNSWLASSAEDDVEKIKISEQNAAMLSPTALRTASAIRFTENDIIYIRDCLLLKSLTESIWKQADERSSGNVASDRERVVHLFQHLMRNMALLPDSETRVPVGLYEAMLTGRGTVDDRIWAFAEALRQRQLDVVLLKPSAPGDASATDVVAAADVLVGVVADGKLLLFDPVRATAVPRSDDSSVIVTDPARLEAVASQERWKSGTAWVVGHPSAFAPRMLVLQERLEASDSAVLYEELVGGTSEIRPLRDRLSEVIGTVWPAESLKVWDVPEQRIAAAAALTEEQRQAYILLMRPLDSPFERDSLNVGKLLADPSVDEEKLSMEERMNIKLEALGKLLESSDELFGKPSRRLLMTRVQQIMGSFDVGMIQDLQQIRIASLQEKVELEVPVDEKKAMVVPFQLPKSILDVQRSAVGDTLYWTSMSQMSRNDMGAAVATLRNYRRQYPDEKSVFPSMTNEAFALLQLGDSKSAATVLKEASVEANPGRLQAQWLLSRLPTEGKPAAKSETNAKDESPASAPPADPDPANAAKPKAEPTESPAAPKEESSAAESPKTPESDDSPATEAKPEN